ncbi:MAG TPA: hypothetical protein VNE62_00610 [Actinomycetota bacterium]|nr:hypothetical protein [Actinomycetota bacterium]
MLVHRMAAALAASMVFAAGLTAAAAPAQAADCDRQVIIFSFIGGTGVTSDPNSIGCTASPEVEFNTNLIYPGSRAIKSRLVSGTASGYCLIGDLLNHLGGGRCGGVVLDEGLVPGTFYYESPTITHPAAAMGCVRGWFDGRGGTEYCTATSLQP